MSESLWTHGVKHVLWTGSSVFGIFQARVMEWVAISYTRESSQFRDQTRVSGISCIGKWILYHWATWEGPCSKNIKLNCTKCSTTVLEKLIIFLKQDRKTLTIKQMIDKLNNRKFKNFCSLKDTFKNIKRTSHRVGKKYLWHKTWNQNIDKTCK